ncbi:TlpA family protein disulfide reductase [Candidatus Woesearchaeota archaeon]|nr:TlpA family protein disulfide reductase [Candidatus Woesearchaeota archaeon]
MARNYFIGLILLLIIFLSACSSANQTAETGNTVLQQASFGINKGDTPPDFSITTIDGKQYRLSQFKEENKPVLLYFWASWCPYCSRDFDVVKNVYPRYTDKAAFLAIDLDLNENKELINKYKEKKGLNGIDFAEGKSNILSDYAIKYTTTKYAISRDGKIIYKGSGVFNEQQWKVLFDAMVGG